MAHMKQAMAFDPMILELIDKKWHSAFMHFMETGNGPAPFLHLLDTDADYQKAFDLAFRYLTSPICKAIQPIKSQLQERFNR